MNHDALQGWLGRQQTVNQLLADTPLLGLAATLDYPHSPWPAGELPPLGHWLYFLPQVRQSLIDSDGHPQRGGFLPAVPLPRRMWAGSALRFHQPVRVGESAEYRSTIADIKHKAGSSGELVFVTVAHELHSERGLLLSERQDIVYREASTSGATTVVAPVADELPALDWTCEVQPDPVLLMRFSALTFNSHRIHYDRDYARDVEGYAGLVVHGPLTATLLMDLFLRHNPGAQVSAFSFRGRRPLLDTAPFTLCGKASPGGAELWAVDSHGQIAMSAEVKAL